MPNYYIFFLFLSLSNHLHYQGYAKLSNEIRNCLCLMGLAILLTLPSTYDQEWKLYELLACPTPHSFCFPSEFFLSPSSKPCMRTRRKKKKKRKISPAAAPCFCAGALVRYLSPFRWVFVLIKGQATNIPAIPHRAPNCAEDATSLSSTCSSACSVLVTIQSSLQIPVFALRFFCLYEENLIWIIHPFL